MSQIRALRNPKNLQSALIDNTVPRFTTKRVLRYFLRHPIVVLFIVHFL